MCKLRAQVLKVAASKFGPLAVRLRESLCVYLFAIEDQVLIANR